MVKRWYQVIWARCGRCPSGSQHVCAAPVEGDIRCWGDNTYSQLNVPVGLGNVLQVKSGGFHSCAVDGTNLTCWGRDDNGQLGTEEFDRSTLGAPDKFFSVGYDFTCGMPWRYPSGSRLCTGSNSYGQHGPLEPICNPIVSTMDSGALFTCLITNRGALECGMVKRFGILNYDALAQSAYLFHTFVNDNSHAMAMRMGLFTHC